MVYMCDSYTPAELRNLPVNTVLNGRHDETEQDPVAEQNDLAATEAAAPAAGSIADEDDKNMQVYMTHLTCQLPFIMVCWLHMTVRSLHTVVCNLHTVINHLVCTASTAEDWFL